MDVMVIWIFEVMAVKMKPVVLLMRAGFEPTPLAIHILAC